MHPRLPIVRYLWEATLPNPDWEFDPYNADDPNRYHHWQLHGYFIITDAPHPEQPDTQKVYATRQLGEVSVLRTTKCASAYSNPAATSQNASSHQQQDGETPRTRYNKGSSVAMLECHKQASQRLWQRNSMATR